MGSSAIMEEACNSSMLSWSMRMEGNCSLQREGKCCVTAGPWEKPKVRRDLKGEENQGDRRGRGWEAERQGAWGPVKMTNHVWQEDRMAVPLWAEWGAHKTRISVRRKAGDSKWGCESSPVPVRRVEFHSPALLSRSFFPVISSRNFMA